MSDEVIELQAIRRGQVALVGGKAAQLGELTAIDGIDVPPGFCVTTAAFRRLVTPAVAEPLRRLAELAEDDLPTRRAVAAELRLTAEAVTLPADLVAAVTAATARLGEGTPVAVRSSATAEDLPTASFAGAHDSFLGVVGAKAVLDHVRRCWASLFTERAIAYRQRQGIDHREVAMAVVVQQLVDARAAGVLFTADPVTGHRGRPSVEAVLGLGEQLVAGQVRPDVYRVHDQVVSADLSTQEQALEPAPAGGTRTRAVPAGLRGRPVLTDAQVLALVELGRRVEARAGHPQDIEWCLDDNGFRLVQARPITTAFPIPQETDGGRHVYVSVGHQQMMTDPMKPLGISVWQLTSRAPMRHAGGRLFVDVTPVLSTPSGRATYLTALSRSDPLIGDALRTVLERGDIVPDLPDPDLTDPDLTDPDPGGPGAAGRPRADLHGPSPRDLDPAIVTTLVQSSRAGLTQTRSTLAAAAGPAVFDAIRADVAQLQRVLFVPENLQAIRASVETSWELGERLREWLGVSDAVDTLTLSAPDNVTSQMGLDLLDLADVIRPHRQVVDALRQAQDDSVLARLPRYAGGRQAQRAIESYLERYGMRCPGEIDLTRPRWREEPTTLFRMVLAAVDTAEPGAAARRTEQGRRAAQQLQDELLARLRELPDGDRRADQVEAMIRQVRAFIGYREYPKYHLVSRYFLYKQALLAEADRLVRAGVLRDREDAFFLTLDELEQVVRSQRADRDLIEGRRQAFGGYAALTVPRVLTSDGEAVVGAYRRSDVPDGALVGLAVSAGVVEGRARVVTDLAHAELAAGDILVTTYTDPSWTPALVLAGALVTEVGGLMTHGAVVAREYGLPAVVGVEHATTLIRDGDRVRVDGSRGYVERLA